jgi:hypothetical protein
MAREECANFSPDASCMGMMFGEKTTQKPLWVRLPSRCVILDNKPCAYFEEHVLSVAEMATEPRRSGALLEASYIYRMAHGRQVVTRACPACGGQLPKRHRFCPDCSLKKRKESNKVSQRRKRGMSCQQLTGKSA